MTGEGKEILYRTITETVMKELRSRNITFVNEVTENIPVGISARHIHLEQNHVDILFGKDYRLTKYRDISQPGQYACEEQVTIVGPKASIERVRILAPLREKTQVEVSKTDAINLGINPPVRQSGDLKGSSSIIVVGPKGKIELDEGCIIADRHIHMSTGDATKLGVKHGQKVRVEAGGEKGGIMNNVVIRVSDRYALELHIDTDDANAFGMTGQEYVHIIQ